MVTGNPFNLLNEYSGNPSLTRKEWGNSLEDPNDYGFGYFDPGSNMPKFFREDYPPRRRGESLGLRQHRKFERHSGTGRGNEIKREGAGRRNWGTSTDELFALDSEVIAEEEDKDLISEKQMEQYNAPLSDVNKEDKELLVNEVEEKEMTLAEYEKILEEKRKSLLALKTEERIVNFDKEFESMKQLSLKNGSNDVFIKLGSDKDAGKRKETTDRDERVKEPTEGEKFYIHGGQGHGRGR